MSNADHAAQPIEEEGEERDPLPAPDSEAERRGGTPTQHVERAIAPPPERR